MKPLLHAENSVKKYGGRIDDYLPIHDFLDSTKSSLGDVRHRAILHNAFGVFICEKIFGHYIEIYSEADRGPNTHNLQMNPKKVSVRDVAEDHIVEDVGYIPSIQDWLKDLPITDWMLGRAQGSAKRAPTVTVPVDKFYLAANSDGVTAFPSPGVPATVFDGCYPSEASLTPPSPDKTEDFMAQVEKYNDLKKKMSDSTKEVLTIAANKFFAAVPKAKAISWTQYTPYFNDGDACTFGVNDPFVLTEEELEDGITYEDDTVFNEIASISLYAKHMDPLDPENYWTKRYNEAKAKPNEFGENAIEAWEAFTKIFHALDSDFLLDAFDDHVQVCLRSDGTTDTEEYRHD
jgi:hypothetical protein